MRLCGEWFVAYALVDLWAWRFVAAVIVQDVQKSWCHKATCQPGCIMSMSEKFFVLTSVRSRPACANLVALSSFSKHCASYSRALHMSRKHLRLPRPSHDSSPWRTWKQRGVDVASVPILKNRIFKKLSENMFVCFGSVLIMWFVA